MTCFILLFYRSLLEKICVFNFLSHLQYFKKDVLRMDAIDNGDSPPFCHPTHPALVFRSPISIYHSWIGD